MAYRSSNYIKLVMKICRRKKKTCFLKTNCCKITYTDTHIYLQENLDTFKVVTLNRFNFIHIYHSKTNYKTFNYYFSTEARRINVSMWIMIGMGALCVICLAGVFYMKRHKSRGTKCKEENVPETRV